MKDEIIREAWQIKDAIGKEANDSPRLLGMMMQRRQQTRKHEAVDLSWQRQADAQALAGLRRKG